jgi:hypothetical protein
VLILARDECLPPPLAARALALVNVIVGERSGGVAHTLSHRRCFGVLSRLALTRNGDTRVFGGFNQRSVLSIIYLPCFCYQTLTFIPSFCSYFTFTRHHIIERSIRRYVRRGDTHYQTLTFIPSFCSFFTSRRVVERSIRRYI